MEEQILTLIIGFYGTMGVGVLAILATLWIQNNRQSKDVGMVQGHIEQMNRRFDDANGHLDRGLTRIGDEIDRLSTKMDSKIDHLENKVDGLSAQMDSKIDHLDSKVDGLSAQMDSKIDHLGKQDGQQDWPSGKQDGQQD